MLASQKKFALIALALALGTSGCGDRELRPLNPCTISGVQIKVPIVNVDKVDLLFMIDNSGSMREEQASLAMEIPRLVQVLASGRLISASGEIRNFRPVQDLRVGVVSSDMGTGGHTVATCSEPNFGDDGILRPTAGCGAATSPRYLGFRPDVGGDPGQFGTDVACVAALGTSGCGFEQQLDAVLKAVTPGTSDIGFVNGTRGHAGGENLDFVRDDSLLAIIMLTDEDDCSASNPDIFNRGSSQFPGDDLNLRCYQYGASEFNAVHPIQRYVDGLLDVHDSSLLVFGAIVGIPPDLAPIGEEATDYAGILGDPRMVETPAVGTPGLVPSCDQSAVGRGLAYPPRRILGVAQGLERREVSVVIQSICQESFSGALNAIIAKIADVLNATCLPRELNQDSEGRVTCDIVEVLPTEGDITRCDQLSAQGRVFRETDTSGAQVCTICQTDSTGNIIDLSAECLALGSNLGWFYESNLTEDCPPERPQRIAFHTGAEPNTGSLIRLECLQTAAAGEGDINIGTGCGGNAAICGTADRAIYPPGLVCDASSNTCQMECTSTDFCVDAGLGGYVCYDHDVNPDTSSLCVNPICNSL